MSNDQHPTASDLDWLSREMQSVEWIGRNPAPRRSSGLESWLVVFGVSCGLVGYLLFI